MNFKTSQNTPRKNDQRPWKYPMLMEYVHAEHPERRGMIALFLDSNKGMVIKRPIPNDFLLAKLDTSLPSGNLRDHWRPCPSSYTVILSNSVDIEEDS
jgi:hypothetical protein